MSKKKIIREVRTVLIPGAGLKAVVRVKKMTYAAELEFGGVRYPDAFNDREPYDRKTHVFYLPAGSAGQAALYYKRKKKNTRVMKTALSLPAAPTDTPEGLLAACDSGFVEETFAEASPAPGVKHRHSLCRDKNGMPVHVHTVTVDPERAGILIGTPGDGTKSVGVRAKVPEMAQSAALNGAEVLAAVNADFFDIWGDFHPSGLCVKNGRVIANADSKRYFVGERADGRFVISSLAEEPGLLPELRQAAAGLQLIVKDGRVHDFAPLEPFGYVRHPRTAAGVTKDGTLLLMEVDGRIPAYSNGATLLDLAEWLIARGAERAVNLDGGGSSIVYTRENGALVLQSNPADLFRPNAKLIRREYNCILVVSRR